MASELGPNCLHNTPKQVSSLKSVKFRVEHQPDVSCNSVSSGYPCFPAAYRLKFCLKELIVQNNQPTKHVFIYVIVGQR